MANLTISRARRRLSSYLVLLLALAYLLFISCFSSGQGDEIQLRDFGLADAAALESGSLGEGLVFAVALVNSPRSTLDAYRDLAQYLGDKVGLSSKLISGKTYAEINSLLRSGDVTIAIVCSGAYVYGENEFGLELLAAPVVRGEQLYQSYLVVAADSTLSNWESLRGKTFAFTDPLSNSGRLVPVYQLRQMGVTSEAFFSKYIFTYSHDNSIKAVANGLVDAASVDSLVYDYALANGQDDANKTKVIWRSPSYAINPVVVSPSLDRTLKRELQAALLNMSEDPEGQRVLARLRFDGFRGADNSAYDSIRQMVQATGAGGFP